MSYWFFPPGRNNKAPVTLKLTDTELLSSSVSFNATIALLREACPSGIDGEEFIDSLYRGSRQLRCWRRVDIGGFPASEKSFIVARQVLAYIFVHSNVVADTMQKPWSILGRVRKIYSLEKCAYLSVEVYQNQRIEGISQLDRFGNERIISTHTRTIVRLRDVLNLINVQHDCHSLGCKLEDKSIIHSANNQFVLNQFKIKSDGI